MLTAGTLVRRPRPVAVLAAVAALAVGVSGCGLSGTSADPAAGSVGAAATAGSTSSAAASSRGAATVALGALRVAPDGPIAGYTRARFGVAWTDDNDDLDGHNGCDTRDDVLRRDLTAVVVETKSKGCVVATGVLTDPYVAGTRISFTRGPKSSVVQIDHVVALGNAWRTGASALTARQRQNIGNDPLNLLAVDGSSNEAKGDDDASTWLPPNVAFRCAYVARQIAVKSKYALSVSSAEKAAMVNVLASCPGEVIPVATATPLSSTGSSKTSSSVG
jgi:hypothetical protein